MTADELRSAEDLPKGLPNALAALWFDARDRWEEAHHAVQSDDSAEAAWVHAYLHRKEGDSGNARYWYQRAGREFFEGPFGKEWEQIVSALLVET